jgi:hypothetical protein
MSSAISAFHWRGQPSIFAAASKQGQGATPQKDHPLRKKPKLSQDNAFTGAGGQIKPERQPPAVYKTPGLVTPSNNGFSIPSRVQAQADTDRRRSIVKGGI